ESFAQADQPDHREAPVEHVLRPRLEGRDHHERGLRPAGRGVDAPLTALRSGTGEMDVPDVEQAVSRSRVQSLPAESDEYLRAGLRLLQPTVRVPGLVQVRHKTRYLAWHDHRGVPLWLDDAEYDAALLRRVGVVRHRLAQHQGGHPGPARRRAVL